MALPHLLVRGIRVALDEGAGELAAHLESLGQPADTAEHVRQTVEALPGLLVALDGALWDRDAPLFARALHMVVLSYLLNDDDLVPAHEGQPVLGLLDDTYLLHRAAQELRAHLGRVEMRSVDGGADLLARVLPAEVVETLEGYVDRAVGRAQEMTPDASA